ncbi:MAG: hypothetical protein Q8R02_06975 [Hyphomonadaceae bacterium]|nr:hypothetical protein [Hyphomonadaceae bacterium]
MKLDLASPPETQAAGQASSESPASTARIKANFARFEAQVTLSEKALASGRLEEAMMYASLAAAVATHKHCGVFASWRLERVIHAVSAAIPDRTPSFARATSAAGYKRVLHVVSEVSPVGGLTRMISRWMAADPSRSHSLAMTRFRGFVPQHMKDAVASRGGKIHILNTEIGSALGNVGRLRDIARGHDLVILHIHCEDMVPLVAFARPDKVPPVLFLNHADHIFWLGSSVGHVVINLRDAAGDISISRRGVSPERSTLMPTVVEPVVRRLSKADARTKLGLDPDATIMVSVARTAKYRSVNGVTFADLHIDLLKKHPEAQLVVVGSGPMADWKPAQDAVGGRIVGLPEQPDPWTYFEAADICVDSYPFVSSTSLMEAAGYGLPMVTLFIAPDEARIFGINHVGLVGTALSARSMPEYNTILSRLIADPAYREAVGRAGEKAVVGAHTPPGWLDWMEAAFQRSVELPPIASPSPEPACAPDRPRFGEPDCRHEEIFGADEPLSNLTKDYMGLLSLGPRLRLWAALRRSGDIRGLSETLRLLLPEWVKSRLRRMKK